MRSGRRSSALQTDEEREQFIEQFWLRRDPTPDTEENEFKEEHYRRIAYANEQLRFRHPRLEDGSRPHLHHVRPAGRNRIASLRRHLRAALRRRRRHHSTYPFEKWRYRYIEGIGNDIIIEFVDPTMSGEYRMTMDPSEKDALLYVPGAGLTMMEQMGMASKTDRFNRTDGTHLGTGNAAAARAHEPVRAPGAVREAAEAAGRSSSRIWKRPSTRRSASTLLPMKVRADLYPA